jgi:hypothetical protein
LHGTLYVNKGVFEFRMEGFSRNETEGSADILSRSSEKRLSLMTSFHKQAGTFLPAHLESDADCSTLIVNFLIRNEPLQSPPRGVFPAELCATAARMDEIIVLTVV